MSSSALPESLARFRTELEDAIRRELDVQATARSNGRGARLLRAVRRRPGRTILAFAAITGATAAALFVSSPWQSSPGFLERAQAALTPPPGRILHMKWQMIVTSEDPACTSTGDNEVWIDLAPPHRYRGFGPSAGAIPESLETAPPTDPGPGGLPCPPTSSLRPVEVGGTLDGQDALRFVPPNKLVRARPAYFYLEDPWAWVRKRISQGRAHREGTTELYGRTLERVRLDPGPPTSCQAPGHCPTEPEYVYFDPETLYLVVWDYARDPTYPLRRQREHYLAYEYLPRTEANLALTDIRAQHPDAIER